MLKTLLTSFLPLPMPTRHSHRARIRIRTILSSSSSNSVELNSLTAHNPVELHHLRRSNSSSSTYTLRSLSLSDTLADALSLLKRLADFHVSVWTCRHSAGAADRTQSPADCRCVGKICLLDVICFISEPHNLKSPSQALQSPISELISKNPLFVRHLEPNARSFPHFNTLNNVFKKKNIVQSNPHIYNEVVNEFEMLHDEVLKVEGMTDEERQHAYVKLIKDEELRVAFPGLPIDAKKKILMNIHSYLVE